MDENMYRNELNQVRYTAEGRRTLTDTLMASNAVHYRNHGKPRRVAVLALAAVLLLGVTAAAVTQSLWADYFKDLEPEQEAVIETLSQKLPAVECNGATMTPLSAFGDENFYYLLLEIRAPEGTVLPTLDEDTGFYQLFGNTAEESITLTNADGQEIGCFHEFDWMPDNDPTDNVITAVIRLWANDNFQFNDGAEKTLHIHGLWVQSPDKVYTPILTGNWDFPIGSYTGDVQSLDLDTTGVSVEDEFCGTVTLESLHISNLGIRYRITWLPENVTEPDFLYPSASMEVVLDDGTTVSIGNTTGSYASDWSETIGYLETPLDLSHVAGVRWGDVFIPLSTD